MLDIPDAPSSCRSCAFMVRCFGQPDEGPLVRPPQIRDLWVTTPIVADGIATRLIVAGRSGPVVLFLHGEGGNAERWVYNLNAVARAGYRAAAVDLPGHGFADKPAGYAHGVAAYAKFIAAVAGRFGEPVTLVGASMGTHVAARVAARRPELVCHLVMAGGAGLPVGPEAIEKLQRQVVYRTREGALERFRRAFWDARIANLELAEHEFRINTSPGAAEAQRALALHIGQELEAGCDPPALRRVATSVQTLLIWGDEDRLTPPALAREAVTIMGGRAQLRLMPKTGHMANFERPGEFNSHLIEFLASSATPVRTAELELAR